MLTEEEYKKEWLEGKHDTDYNNCRFCDDKLKYCRDWMLMHIPFANPENPTTATDFICKQKLKMVTDKEYCALCSDWADKIKVNTLLDNLGMSEIKIPNYYAQYGKFGNACFDLLPDEKLIIKCNHASGWNVFLDKTKPFEPKHIVNKINEWLSLNYSYVTGYEAQYENITPGVIIEPILIDKPTDYGFWCFNGEIKGISLTKKFGKNLEEYIAFVNEDGSQCSWRIGLKPEQDKLNKKQLEMVQAMIPYVKTLAKPFDFVRVDMYYVKGKVYFGETTFTPCSGRVEYVETES